MPHLALTPRTLEPPGPRMSRQEMFDTLTGLRAENERRGRMAGRR